MYGSLGQRVHPLDQQKNDRRHQQKVDDHSNKGAVIQGCGAGRLRLSQRGVFAAVQRNKPVVEINTSGNQRNDWHHNVVNQRGNNFLKRTTDNDANSHVDHIAPHDERLKLAEDSFSFCHAAHPFLF